MLVTIYSLVVYSIIAAIEKVMLETYSDPRAGRRAHGRVAVDSPGSPHGRSRQPGDRPRPRPGAFEVQPLPTPAPEVIVVTPKFTG